MVTTFLILPWGKLNCTSNTKLGNQLYREIVGHADPPPQLMIRGQFGKLIPLSAIINYAAKYYLQIIREFSRNKLS